MPLLSYNCLNKLNLYPMHLFRCQRTWFYLADLGHPHPGYQTRSALKGTPRHNRQRDSEGRKMGIQGKSSKVQNIYSQSFKVQQGRERKQENKRAKVGEFLPILETIQNITQPPKKHMPKHAHIRYHSLPQKSSSPSYLGR